MEDLNREVRWFLTAGEIRKAIKVETTALFSDFLIYLKALFQLPVHSKQLKELKKHHPVSSNLYEVDDLDFLDNNDELKIVERPIILPNKKNRSSYSTLGINSQ